MKTDRSPLRAAALLLTFSLGACGAHAPVGGTLRQGGPQQAVAATRRVALGTVQELTSLDMTARLGAEQARHAEWAFPQPILVGSGFDLALAFAMEDGVGAGLAAGQQRRRNREFAHQLANLPPIELDALLATLLERCHAPCAELVTKQLRLYGVLYGSREVRLRVIVEAEDEQGTQQYISVGPPQGTGFFLESRRLRAAFEDGLERIAHLIATSSAFSVLSTAKPHTNGRCKVGDRAYMCGEVTDRAPPALLVKNELYRAFVDCPAEALELRP